jgi:hypothetical protein
VFGLSSRLGVKVGRLWIWLVLNGGENHPDQRSRDIACVRITWVFAGAVPPPGAWSAEGRACYHGRARGQPSLRPLPTGR